MSEVAIALPRRFTRENRNGRESWWVCARPCNGKLMESPLFQDRGVTHVCLDHGHKWSYSKTKGWVAK